MQKNRREAHMKKLKNIVLLLLVCLSVLPLTACSGKNVEGELTDIFDRIYADIKEDEMPMLMTVDALHPFE